jgi:helicase MOV-10
VIIGDPDVLALDPLWREFLNYIHRRGGWKGSRIGWDPNEPVDRGDTSSSPATMQGSRRRGVNSIDHYTLSRRLQGVTEMDELIARTRAMVLGNVPVDDREDDDEETRRQDDIEGNTDRPWREAE